MWQANNIYGITGEGLVFQSLYGNPVNAHKYTANLTRIIQVSCVLYLKKLTFSQKTFL